jgi:starch synthase
LVGDGRRMKVAFVSSEVVPFAKTGGLADVCGALPLALEAQKVPTIIILPYYKEVELKKYKVEEIEKSVLRVGIGNNISVYFVKANKYFNRVGIYGTAQGDYPDNLERYKYFCEKSISIIKKHEKDVTIIHCHDWQASFIPILLKKTYTDDKDLVKVKCVLTIHNLAFQGIFTKQQFKAFGFDKLSFKAEEFEFYGRMNLLKAGIINSDVVTTVSAQYAKEIQTVDLGCGLESVLKQKKTKPTGIVNGIDTSIWNPASDKHLLVKYGKDKYTQGKLKHKQYLQKKCNLTVDPNIPLFGSVGRIAHQKGVDLITEAIIQFDEENVQFIVQGLGDKEMLDGLKRLTRRMKGKVALVAEFDEQLAHRIYAGSDFFLMPSRFEPCGLSQMISMSYGALPIVTNTGGLADTVINYDELKGNGFVLSTPSTDALVERIEEAMVVFSKKTKLKKLIKNAFSADFSWKKSAKHYKNIYTCLS